MSDNNPSDDDFNHNVNLIEGLDRFTSSTSIYPPSKPTIKEARDNLKKYELSNGYSRARFCQAISDARRKYDLRLHTQFLTVDKNASPIVSPRLARLRRAGLDNLLPYIDDEDVIDYITEHSEISWLASEKRDVDCSENARKDILAQPLGKNLRIYLESLHKNIIMLEKRLSQAESYIEQMQNLPVADPC